jgi:hypothetical protein
LYYSGNRREIRRLFVELKQQPLNGPDLALLEVGLAAFIRLREIRRNDGEVAVLRGAAVIILSGRDICLTAWARNSSFCRAALRTSCRNWDGAPD